MSRRKRWLLGAVALVGVSVGAATLFRQRGPTAEIPEIDLSSVHPRVAQVVNKAREQVVQNPSSGKAWGELGMVLMAHHLRKAARACFREATRLQPREFRWLYYRAFLVEEIDYQKAVAAYRAAAEVRPDYGPLRYRLGMTLMRMDRLDEAEQEFQRAVELGPEMSLPRMGLGWVAIARGQWANARDYFVTAASLPNAPQRKVHVELARIDLKLGDLDAAYREHQQVARLPEVALPKVPDPLLQDVTKLDALMRGYAERADFLAAQGNYAAAVNAYRVLVRERPNFPRARFNLAHTLELGGRLTEAIAEYRQLLKQFPEEAQTHYGLARALERAGRTDAAIEQYRTCTKLKPDFAQAYFSLGLLLQNRKDLAGAMQAFSKAVDADPSLAPAQLALGVLLQQNGKLSDAIVHMRAAVELVPGDRVPREYLKRALQQQKKNGKDATERRNAGSLK